MHNELNIIDKIKPDKPFEKCKLGRLKSAEILTNLIYSNNEGMVLALNDKWGAGKTTFVRMWQLYLKDKKFETIYFNAWENDFDDNPLIAILSEFKNEQKQMKTLFNKVLEKAAVIGKHTIPSIAENLIEQSTGINFIELIKQISEGRVEILQDEVDNYANRKKNIEDFRINLEMFVKEITSDMPLVFIIDELDRCRPNYSVQLLEQIKHFFSVPNIIFVLSIDKTQLGNAIKGYYGSDKIDANEYLRRFIDLEYSFPRVDIKEYCDYLYEVLKFKDYFESEEKIKTYDSKSFKKISQILFSNGDYSIRVQEKIFIHARVALRMFKPNQYVFPELFLFLVYLKITDNSLYLSIYRKELSLKSLQEIFFKKIIYLINKESNFDLVRLEYLLIDFYNSGLGDKSKIIQIEGTENKPEIFHLESLIDNTILKKGWSFYKSSYQLDIDLDYLLNKIEMANNFES